MSIQLFKIRLDSSRNEASKNVKVPIDGGLNYSWAGCKINQRTMCYLNYLRDQRTQKVDGFRNNCSNFTSVKYIEAIDRKERNK